jgi:hypothetical protein
MNQMKEMMDGNNKPKHGPGFATLETLFPWIPFFPETWYGLSSRKKTSMLLNYI